MLPLSAEQKIEFKMNYLKNIEKNKIFEKKRKELFKKTMCCIKYGEAI